MEKMPANYHISDSDQNRPPLPIYEKMLAIDQMPAKNKKRNKCPSYETEEDFMADPNYRRNVQKYDASSCYE